MIEASDLWQMYKEAINNYAYGTEKMKILRLCAISLIAIVQRLDKVLESLREAHHGN